MKTLHELIDGLDSFLNRPGNQNRQELFPFYHAKMALTGKPIEGYQNLLEQIQENESLLKGTIKVEDIIQGVKQVRRAALIKEYLNSLSPADPLKLEVRNFFKSLSENLLSEQDYAKQLAICIDAYIKNHSSYSPNIISTYLFKLFTIKNILKDENKTVSEQAKECGPILDHLDLKKDTVWITLLKQIMPQAPKIIKEKKSKEEFSKKEKPKEEPARDHDHAYRETQNLESLRQKMRDMETRARGKAQTDAQNGTSLYDVFQNRISKISSTEEIVREWKQLFRSHKDLAALNEAKDILSQPHLKKIYDETLEEAQAEYQSRPRW